MIGVVAWAVAIAACLVVEGIALVRPHDAWPTFSDILRVVTASRLGRWTLFALWLWLGWHTFVRGWHFFLRDPVGDEPPPDPATRRALAVAPVTLEELLRQDVIPLVMVYVVVLLMLSYCARSIRARGPAAARARVSDSTRARGWKAFGRHLLVTSGGGYALFLSVVALYYGLVANQTPAFLRDAIGGGAFLAFAIGVPSFALLSWIATALRRH